jgi:branched-chain amino acid transport system substrate-binding protein
MNRTQNERGHWVILVASALVIGSLFGAIHTTNTCWAQGDIIKVGLSAPLSGPVAWMGEDYTHGATLATEIINKKGGVLGKQIKLFTADDACSPAQAAGSYRKLIDFDAVDVIIGAGCSGPTLAAMPIVEKAEIANLTPASTNPDITRRAGVGGNRWQFRLNVDDSLMARHFAKYIGEQAKSVTLLAANNDFGRGAVAAYKEEFGKVGVRFAGEEYFEQGQADFRPTLTRIKGQNPEAILLVMEGKDAAVFIRQFQEVGMKQKIFARGSVVTAEFIEALGKDVQFGEGIQEATLWAIGQDSELDNAYKVRWGTPPKAHGAMAYYAMLAMAQAIQNSGKTNRAGIRDALQALKVELPGLGSIDFDDHNQAHPNVVITQLKEGKVTLLKKIPTK